MNIIVDSLLVNYKRQGKGSAVVLLHGWGDRLETFDALAQSLEHDYEVIRLDLAGFGKSQPPHEPWGLDEYAAYVEHFLAKINVTPFAVLGHSNGGAIAIKGLAAHRLHTDKLILLSSAGIRASEKTRKRLYKLIAKTGKVGTALLPAGTRASLRQKLYASAGSDMMVAPHMQDTFKRVVGQDVQSDAASLTTETLIISGSDDTATPPSFAHLFGRLIPGSTVIILNDAGHFAHQQHPDEVANAVKNFLRS